MIPANGMVCRTLCISPSKSGKDKGKQFVSGYNNLYIIIRRAEKHKNFFIGIKPQNSQRKRIFLLANCLHFAKRMVNCMVSYSGLFRPEKKSI